LATDQQLLEREREVEKISAALGAAVGGNGGALTIEGKAGTGKTRLLAVARQQAIDAGLSVHAARATELERDFPFAVLRQLLGASLKRLGAREREAIFEGAGAARGALGFEGGDRSADTFSVLHAVYWVVANLAERGPLFLIIDDAHLADPASLDWLTVMLPRLGELPVLLALTRRTDVESSPELTKILSDQSVETGILEPLSSRGTMGLIEGTLGRQADDSFAAVCHEITGGNPFLVTELARELVARSIEPRAEQSEAARNLAPQRVAQMVLARIARLPGPAAALARSVAVLGEGSELRLAAVLAGLDPETGREAADSLRRAAIFDPGRTLRFVHPLVQNAVYADLAAGERGAAHATAAALLRKHGAPPETVATQILAGEERGDEAAVKTLLEAARRSLADGAPRAAVAYLTRALREPPAAKLRVEVLETLLSAGLRAADHEALAAVEPELRAVLESEPSSGPRLAVPLTTAMALGGRFDEAVGILEAATETAVTEGDVESAFRLEAQLRTVAVIVPSVPEVDLQKYVDEVEPDSPVGRLAAAVEARAAAVNGTATDATSAAKRALGKNGAIFEEEPEIAASMMAVLTLIAADEVEAAREAVDRALEIARDRDAAPDLCRAWQLSGFVGWAAGDLVAAEADLQQAMELARMAGMIPLLLACAGPFAQVMFERDEHEAVDAVLQTTGTAAGPVPESGLLSLLFMVRAQLRLERGLFTEAVDDFEALSRQGERLGFGPGPMAIGAPFACRALVALERVEEARELAETCLYYGRRWGAPSTVSHVLRAVAVARGRVEEVEVLQEAAAMLEDSPRRLQRLYALVELGAALRRQNRRAEARAPLREGLELARRCGASRLAKRAREELQATGETVRRYAPIGVESLTPSERRVAEMAASGMTNRQIAQSLFVTLKTVEAHLSAAYDKLDISSRRQLQSALAASK
jgi:DNA-binding CsgD family transcriptional regulator/tetratricopeptide (TPR) repeat protein